MGLGLGTGRPTDSARARAREAATQSYPARTDYSRLGVGVPDGPDGFLIGEAKLEDVFLPHGSDSLARRRKSTKFAAQNKNAFGLIFVEQRRGLFLEVRCRARKSEAHEDAFTCEGERREERRDKSHGRFRKVGDQTMLLVDLQRPV